MRKANISTTIVTTILANVLPMVSVSAQCDLAGQPFTTVRTPFIEGATVTPPGKLAPEGQAPPLGDGSVPSPVTSGMGGPPTLLPYVPITPANDMGYPSYRVQFSPTSLSAPGELGPSIWTPPPPSTLGADPDMIHAPLDFHEPPAVIVPISRGGGIKGSAPTQRWGGDTTQDFGRYRHRGPQTYDFGQKMSGSTSEDGPHQKRANAKPTEDLYGRRQSNKNNLPSIQTIAEH